MLEDPRPLTLAEKDAASRPVKRKPTEEELLKRDNGLERYARNLFLRPERDF